MWGWNYFAMFRRLSLPLSSESDIKTSLLQNPCVYFPIINYILMQGTNLKNTWVYNKVFIYNIVHSTSRNIKQKD
jgi:hypothetical protein